MIFISMLSSMMLLIPVLINVAFLTLMERKILGLSQSRKGPNKVSMGGLLQPFADAIKLFMKENVAPHYANKLLFLAGPSLALFLMLGAWALMPWKNVDFDLSLLLLIMILGLGLYPLLLSGWASHSAYALIGALRGIAQTISYEVSLALVLMSVYIFLGGLSLSSLSFLSKNGPWPILIPLFFLWLVIGLAETNRTPFDFAEGESELVSGFNIEYGAGGFALIFMAEYGSILLLSFVAVFLGGAYMNLGKLMPVLGSLVAFFWIWARATLPRYRYDSLMNLAWKNLLPITLFTLLFYMIM